MRHVLLIFEEQAVEADRCVLVGGAGERTEAKAGVEARLAHGAVALVVAGREPMPIDDRQGTHARGRDVAARFGKGCGLWPSLFGGGTGEGPGAVPGVR